MRKFIWLGCFLLFGFYVGAQQITLENIWGFKYYSQGLPGLKSTNDGAHYTLQDESGIYKFSYQSIVSQNMQPELVVSGSFDEYSYSADEKLIMLQENAQSIYRHSSLGKFTVYDVSNKKKTILFDGKMIQEPTFSPDNSKVAFVFENNLYYQDLSNGKVVKITTDGKKNEIINGICDWVYEEEFAFVRHFDWNSDGTQLAFVKFDESKVKEVYIPIYGDNLYPEEMRYKYPKAGEENSKVSLWLFDVKSAATENVKLDGLETYYIPKIKFTKKSNLLTVITSNRNQNSVDVASYDLKAKKIKKLFNESDKAYVETDNFTLEFLDDNSFLWTSERDGNRHLYHYAEDGKLIKQVTKGDWEITSFYGYDAKNKMVYFQSNAKDNKRISTDKYVNAITIDGSNLKTLTPNSGTNSASFSTNFAYYINEYSSVKNATSFKLYDNTQNKELGLITDNERVAASLAADNAGTKEIFTLKTASGLDLNAWIIKPKDFNPSKKYPVLMYQYSGPGSQEVTNSYFDINDDWFLMLAQKGYLVICVDGRGTGLRGSNFKKQTYLNLGKMEVEDQIEAAKAIGKLAYVDATRIGIWGWSFGGFMSSNCILRAGDVFKSAIAVAPVTNWRFYDTVYTERFLRTPQENPNGYDQNSPVTYAKQFDDKRNKFLLVHGTADDNVHFQNSTVLSTALINANKAFDQAYYPDKNHGIYGGNTRLQLFRKLTDFILENL